MHHDDDSSSLSETEELELDRFADFLIKAYLRQFESEQDGHSTSAQSAPEEKPG